MYALLRIVTAVAIAILAAVAAIRQPVVSKLTFEGNERSSSDALRRHVVFLTETVSPRGARNPENLDRAADYIANVFRESGARVEIQTFDAYRRTYRNVIARYGPERGAVLVAGAHYDAFCETGELPGADDNASGTAGLLELARLLGRKPPHVPVLLVAYSTEEPPFFGSDRMGSAVHAASLSNIEGMICLEMIGYYSDKQTWPNWVFELLYPSRGDFIAVGGGWTDRHLVRHVKRAMLGAGGIPVYSFTGPREALDGSDHRNYWDRGWPAVLVTDTAFLRNPHYHTKNDTADTLDYQRMARVVDGVFNALVTAPVTR